MKLVWFGLILGIAACGGGREDDQELATSTDDVTCGPQMRVFPVSGPHNIGFDRASCGATCAVTCPDQNANSDWGGDHHGIDVFAHRGAELVAVTDGTIVRVGTPSRTSGLRVRLRDNCGWEYYYGHMESAAVFEGQHVVAGQVVGAMGSSGAASVHLHFNVSANGDYAHDINPLDLLRDTSATACSSGFQPLYRHWNAFITDHYYSLDAITNGGFGYDYEGTEGSAARTEIAGTVPLYRLWLDGRDHFYTTSSSERAFATAVGYRDEGVAAYVLPAGSGAQPMHRYWNAFAEDHFYTTTPIPDGAYGYGYEGVAWETP